MRFKESNISIPTIEGLYSFFESAALHLDYSWDFLKPISKLKKTTSDAIVLHYLQWELACFSFEFRGSELFSLAYSFDSITEAVQQYPSSTDFEEAGFEYIKNRLDEVKNPLLKARYSHLLWKAPKGIKNKKYAVGAIESYFEAIAQLLNLKEGKQDKRYMQVSNHYESLIGLCCEVNYNNKALIIELTNEILHKRTVPFFLRHSVMDTMLKNPKYFKQQDFHGSLNVFEKELTELDQVDYHLMVTYYLPTALKIAQKMNIDIRKWHDRIGYSYVRLAEKETQEERYWIKQDYYTQAIHAFGRAVNLERKKEVEQLYFELKPKVKLPSVEVKLDVTELYKELENQAESIIKRPSESIYAIIMVGKGIFPSSENLRNQSKNSEYDFMNSVYTVDFDRNKNISSSRSDQNEPFINPYNWEIQGLTLPFLEFIFTKGIQSGKLDFENMILFLKQYTWFGKPFTRIDLGGEAITINWIKMLAPAIVEYFIQTKSSLENKLYSPDYTLCVDSLALKLEGLLRKFL